MRLFAKLNSVFEELTGLDFESQARMRQGWSLENRAKEAIGEEGGIVKGLFLYNTDWDMLQLKRKRAMGLYHGGRVCIWGGDSACYVKNWSCNSMDTAKQYPCTELVIIHGDDVTFDNCTFNGKGLRCAVRCECKSVHFKNCTFKKCGHHSADLPIVKIVSTTRGNLHCKVCFEHSKFVDCCSSESVIEVDGDVRGDVVFENCLAGAGLVKVTHANTMIMS